MREEAEGFECLIDALDGEWVAAGVVGTALVDIDEAVVGFRARPYAVEVSTLCDDTVRGGMPGLGFPVGLFPRSGVGRVDVVVAMVPDVKEAIEGFWDEAGKRRGSLFCVFGSAI